jgi:hypothetical protein
MKSSTTQCQEHAEYLDALTLADGEGRDLPQPAAMCRTCHTNFGLFVVTRELLRWRGRADAAPLGEDWQAEVWLRIAEMETTAKADTNVVRFPAASAAPRAQTPRKRWNHLWWSVAAFLAGGVLASVMIVESDPAQSPAASLANAPQQGKARPQPAGAVSVNVALHAYTLGRQEGETLRAGARVDRGERLSFDYLNAPSSVGDAMRYLTVVAVQQSEQRDREDVRLVTLMRSRRIGPTENSRPREINSDVQIDAPAGNMTIYGVFSREPLAPSAIENAVLSDGSLPGVHFSELSLLVNRRD